MKRNLATGLRRRRARYPMRDYDSSPPPLRAWLADAALSWSPRSALRIYERAFSRSGGDVAAALAELERKQTALLARDPARLAADALCGAQGVAATGSGRDCR